MAEISRAVVCPFCLTISFSADEGDDCDNCGADQFIGFEDYQLRLNSSFMDIISKERWLDE